MIALLAAIAIPVVNQSLANSSIAVSANNIRQLSVGTSSYLADNNYTFWKYKEAVADPGTIWWFGFETQASSYKAEGQREYDPLRGPLAGYVPAGVRPDPSFTVTGKSFKPKYKSGYLGIGYNILLGGGWGGTGKLKKYWELSDPAKVVVFATSAQVNTFQRPASASNPMIEEFYAIDQSEKTVHFRHHGFAMVAYANGSAGLLPMDESTRDPLAPKANIGRFAAKGSKKYLE